MDTDAIENAVAELHREIWTHRRSLFSGHTLPRQMLEPWAAAAVLDLDYVEMDSLGRFGSGKDRFEVAGALDRSKKIVAVSLQFQPRERKFTGAHEVGHHQLHKGVLHFRDRPVFEMDTTKPTMEREADYFAASFLAPPNLLQQEFRSRFGTDRLVLTDLVAYYLTRGRPQELLGAPTNSLAFPLAVARASSLGSYPFTPLARQFGISDTAMAIRLRELHFVSS